MSRTTTDVDAWAAKRHEKLTREISTLGADPNGERSTQGGWAQSCSEVRREYALVGGLRESLLAIYDTWEPHSGESSPLELMMRGAMRDSMLTFRERLVLVALIDYANDEIQRPRMLRNTGARTIANDLGMHEVDVQSAIAALITRGWLPRPSDARRPLKPSLRFEIMDRDGFRCVYCGASSDEETLHIDHITPVSKGGTDDASNLATACETCNLGKSARLLKTPLRLVPR